MLKLIVVYTVNTNINTLLVTAGLPWTVIPVEQRSIYMATLEKASVEGDISDFAKFIFGLINEIN